MRRIFGGLGIWAAAGLLIGGCASVQGAVGMGPMVSEADMGRLSQNDLGPVSDARQRVGSMEQARNRAVLRLDDAKGQLAMAVPAVSAADSGIDAAKIGLANAQETGDQAKIQKAAHQLDLATTFKKEREARVDYLKREVDLRKAEVTAADRRLDLAKAQLERSKLVALEQAKNPAASKYNAGLFEAEVDSARRSVDAAEHDVAMARQSAGSTFEGWQAVRRTYAEQQGLAPVGGGQPAGQSAAPQAAPPAPANNAPAAPEINAPKQPSGQPATPGNP